MKKGRNFLACVIDQDFFPRGCKCSTNILLGERRNNFCMVQSKGVSILHPMTLPLSFCLSLSLSPSINPFDCWQRRQSIPLIVICCLADRAAGGLNSSNCVISIQTELASFDPFRIRCNDERLCSYLVMTKIQWRRWCITASPFSFLYCSAIGNKERFDTDAAACDDDDGIYVRERTSWMKLFD